MKKIALISTSFPEPNYASGQEAAGTFVWDFAHSLTQYGPVEVIAPAQQEAYFQNERLSIRYFAVPQLPLSSLKPYRPQDGLKILKTLKQGQAAVDRSIQRFKPDHLFALWALPSGYWAKNTGLPYSIWALGSDIWSLKRIPLLKEILKKVLKKAAHCFADGYELANQVEQISGRDCCFLPSSRIMPDQGPKILKNNPPYRLAFLGRWHVNKGVDILLQAIDLLQAKDWLKIEKIKIYGGGPLHDQVHQMVQKWQKLNYPIEVGGYLSKNEAAQLLHWTDYLILPSRIESIPVIFSDALQMNCPMIANPVGDIPRLFKQAPVGILSSSIQSNDLYQAIQTGLNTPPIRFESGIKTLKKQFKLPPDPIEQIYE